MCGEGRKVVGSVRANLVVKTIPKEKRIAPVDHNVVIPIRRQREREVTRCRLARPKNGLR
jgi:hypothetical protein